MEQDELGANAAAETVQAVVGYWDRARLATPQSSTSSGNSDLAFFDNAVENLVLARLLGAWCTKWSRAVDVGAGQGRFAALLAARFAEVVLIEPAEHLYSDLRLVAAKHGNARCQRMLFEAMPAGEAFDLILVSGVLYFYNDAMLEDFADRVACRLSPRGVWVVRDFVAVESSQRLQSAYVPGATCYYRTPDRWRDLTARHGMEFLGIEASKPPVRWLRRGVIARALLRRPWARALRRDVCVRFASRGKARRLGRQGVATAFLGMRAP